MVSWSLEMKSSRVQWHGGRGCLSFILTRNCLVIISVEVRGGQLHPGRPWQMISMSRWNSTYLFTALAIFSCCVVGSCFCQFCLFVFSSGFLLTRAFRFHGKWFHFFVLTTCEFRQGQTGQRPSPVGAGRLLHAAVTKQTVVMVRL